MPKTIEQLFVGTAAVVLICAAGCTPRKGSEELAAQFLKTSGLHVLYAEAYVMGYRASALRDRKPEREINCVESKLNPELVLALYTDLYSAEFSDDELRQGISFFESEAGKALVRSEQNLMREQTGRPTEQVQELSPLEVERINAFGETRIGMLTMTPDSSLARSSKEKLKQKIYPIFNQCENAR